MGAPYVGADKTIVSHGGGTEHGIGALISPIRQETDDGVVEPVDLHTHSPAVSRDDVLPVDQRDRDRDTRRNDGEHHFHGVTAPAGGA